MDALAVNIEASEPAHRQGVAGFLFQPYHLHQKKPGPICSPLDGLDLTGNRKKKGGGEQDKRLDAER
jgi:hypothetical protein